MKSFALDRSTEGIISCSGDFVATLGRAMNLMLQLRSVELQGNMADWCNASLQHVWPPSVAGAQPREPITPREPSKRTAKVGDYKLWVDSGRATKLTARKSKTAAPVAISDCDRPQE